MEWIALLLILWIISSFLYHKSLAKDSKRFYESDLPIEPQPTIVDDILGNCVLPPIVPHSKPPKRTVDQSANPFDPQYQIAEPIKRSFNQFMSAQDKYAYMFSDKWYNLRNQVFERDNYTCQSCGSNHYLRCHHIDYSMLGDEPLHHLTTLCGGSNGCHQKIHNLLGYDRNTIYPLASLKNLP